MGFEHPTFRLQENATTAARFHSEDSKKIVQMKNHFFSHGEIIANINQLQSKFKFDEIKSQAFFQGEIRAKNTLTIFWNLLGQFHINY